MQDTMEANIQLLNYCTTHPDATVHYPASDIVLWIYSDAFYLTPAPKSPSHMAWYYFLSTMPQTAPAASDTQPPDNGTIGIHCQHSSHPGQ